jgi:hypothetical protein
MSLITKLKESELSLQGTTPSTRDGAKNTSTLHSLSSLTDKPEILKQPSVLDLDGKTPSKYLDNPPK